VTTADHDLGLHAVFIERLNDTVTVPLTKEPFGAENPGDNVEQPIAGGTAAFVQASPLSVSETRMLHQPAAHKRWGGRVVDGDDALNKRRDDLRDTEQQRARLTGPLLGSYLFGTLREPA
jgi:hypothetical protein